MSSSKDDKIQEQLLRAERAKQIAAKIRPGEEAKVVRRMAMNSCAFYASQYLTGPSKPPYNGRFILGPHHRVWSNVVETHDRSCFIAHRGSGKCSKSLTFLRNPSGNRIHIKDWEGGPVLCLNLSTGKLVYADSTPAKYMGKQRCVTVTTRTGRELTLTEDHPLLRFAWPLQEGWTPANELQVRVPAKKGPRQVGDRIAVPRQIPRPMSTKRIREPWLLGLLVGDGHNTGGIVGFNTTDAPVVEAVKDIADKQGWNWREAPVSARPNAVFLGLSSVSHRPADLDDGPLAWRRYHGVTESSYHLRVPPDVFQASDSDLAKFLAGYMDADGGVDRGGAEFYSVHKELLRDTQHLLLRFGIIARLKRKKGRYKGQMHLSWRLTIGGQEVVQLAKVLCPHMKGHTRQALEELAQKTAAKASAGAAIDLVPAGAEKLFSKTEHWHRLNGGPIPRRHAMGRPKYQAIAANDGSPAADIIAHSDILWDEVESLKYSEEDVYAVTVPEHHNYVADDIVMHNCLVEDALVHDSRGLSVPVQHWEGGDVYGVQNRSTGWQLAPAVASASTPRPELVEAYEITLEDGRQTRVAFDHQLLTPTRWRTASSLEPGQLVAVPNKLRFASHTPIRHDLAFDAQRPVKRGLRAAEMCFLPELRSWLAEATRDRLLAFLLGLSSAFATRPRPGSWRWEADEALRSDIFHLCTRLGLQVRVLFGEARRDGMLAFDLSGESAVKFCTETAQLLREADQRPRNVEQLELTAKIARAQLGRHHQAVQPDRLPVHQLHFRRFLPDRIQAQAFISRHRLYQIVEESTVPRNVFGNFASPASDVRFVPIRSKEELGAKQTYMIQVPWLESHLADDIVTHNSYFFGMAYPLWQIEKAAYESRGPIKIYMISNAQEQAEERLETMKVQVEENKHLQHLLPPNSAGKQWSKTRLKFRDGSIVLARGFKQQLRGGHPHAIVCDDVVDDEAAFSAATRRRQHRYFFGSLSNMPLPGGHLHVIGTPQSKDDLYAELSVNKRYKYVRLPAVDEEGKILWPAVFSPQTLADKKLEIGAMLFTREYLCVPISSETSLFPDELFPPSIFDSDVHLGAPDEVWDQLGIVHRVTSVDFGISATQGSDYTVVTTLGMTENGTIWVMGIERYRGRQFHEQLRRIEAVYERFHPSKVVLEANQAQQVFGQELKRLTDIPVILFNMGKSKHSFHEGVPSLRVPFEQERVRFPFKGKHSERLIERLCAELQSFTLDESGKVVSVADHDDMGASFYIGVRHLKGRDRMFTMADDRAFDPALGKPSEGFQPSAPMLYLPEGKWHPGSVKVRGPEDLTNPAPGIGFISAPEDAPHEEEGIDFRALLGRW